VDGTRDDRGRQTLENDTQCPPRKNRVFIKPLALGWVGGFAKVDNVFLRLGGFAKVDNRFGYEKWT
jgi:hypothetical protein